MLEKDDQHRRELGLPTPSLEDFKEIRGLKWFTSQHVIRLLARFKLIDRKDRPRDGKQGSTAGGFRGKFSPGGAKRGRGRGRGGHGGRGGRDGFPRGHRGFRGPPSQRGRYQMVTVTFLLSCS